MHMSAVQCHPSDITYIKQPLVFQQHAFVLHRGMRGDQARKVCPEVQLVQVPTAHGKADLTLYRDAGKLVRKTVLPPHNHLLPNFTIHSFTSTRMSRR